MKCSGRTGLRLNRCWRGITCAADTSGLPLQFGRVVCIRADWFGDGNSDPEAPMAIQTTFPPTTAAPPRPRVWPPVLLLAAFWAVFAVLTWTEFGIGAGFFGWVVLMGG